MPKPVVIYNEGGRATRTIVTKALKQAGFDTSPESARYYSYDGANSVDSGFAAKWIVFLPGGDKFLSAQKALHDALNRAVRSGAMIAAYDDN